MAWVIDSGMYFAAAQKCHLLAGDISLALGPLHSTLVHECGGMAGDHEKSAAWTTGYDQHAADIVTLAATLANALQRFGDVLAANGYNWWHANRAKASGPEPDRPSASEPLYDSGMALPTTAKGDNGPGLDEGAVAGLLAQVGRIPNGDVTKLGKARDAWQTFADHSTVTGAADRIKGINAAFTGSTDPNIADIEAKLTTLTRAAEMLAQASKDLVAPVGEHRDALTDMRDDIQAAVATATKELATAIIITAGIVAITAFASAGLAAPAAAAGGGAVTVEIVTTTAGVIKNAVTISRLLIIFGSVVAVGTASGAFTAIPDLTANGINAALASIAAMSIHVADDGEIGADSQAPDVSARIEEAGLDSEGEEYVRSKHFPGGARVDDSKGIFDEAQDPYALADAAAGKPATGPNADGHYERVVESDEIVGVTSQQSGAMPTRRYLVVQDKWGSVRTMYPIP
ncbi:hypothetical protein ABZV91_14825 [Nocardia sp. NPDC004568]|uniref:hypothetical protein n=1 Tax=Nocardia sp. NPDC004568 TaxID=3154551 RepID=UPI0033AA2875